MIFFPLYSCLHFFFLSSERFCPILDVYYSCFLLLSLEGIATLEKSRCHRVFYLNCHVVPEGLLKLTSLLHCYLFLLSPPPTQAFGPNCPRNWKLELNPSTSNHSLPSFLSFFLSHSHTQTTLINGHNNCFIPLNIK